MPIRIGARGGGNNLYFVDTLPLPAVAIDDAVYVLPAGTFWKIFQQPVAAVPAVPSSIARTAIMDSPNGIWLGALMAAPALPATRSFYFGSPVTDREFYDSTGPTDPWTVTDIMTVRAEPNAIWLGDDVDTDDEAREYFRINGFNSSDTYYYYESTSETVDQVTAYTPMVPEVPAHTTPVFAEIAEPSFGPGPPQNTFTGTDRAAAQAARDTYATANASWLAAYDANFTRFILLSFAGTTAIENRYNMTWHDVTGVVQGPPGRDGVDANAGASIAARLAAEAAQAAAETAQAAAETARTGAETAETNAETAETNAGTSATAAQTSAASAQTASTAAGVSETAAQTSATDADADRVAAEAARDAAQAALAGIPTDATTLAAVLAAIMEGSNVTIDRSVDGQITVSASGAGTGVDLATVLAAIMGGTNVNIDRTTDGQITISATGAGGTGITLATALAAIMEGTGITIDRTTTGEITLSADGLNTAAVNTLIGAAGHLVAASNLSDVADAATALGNLGGRTQSEIDTQADARIAALVNAFARDNASLIPVAQIPAAIARVADLVNGINQISYSGLGTGPHLTLIRDLGQSEELPLPDWLVPFNAALTGDPTSVTPPVGDNDRALLRRPS